MGNSGRFTLASAAKIALREARASSGKFLFVVLAVGLGVGALFGVKGFSQAFEGMLLRDARQLLAADLSVRLFNMPDSGQEKALDALAERGVQQTWITETVSMVSTPQANRPLLAFVKAVEPQIYPFYGEIELDPPGRLVDHLNAETLAASDDLLIRLDLQVGDRLRLGDADFVIGARVVLEPDRMTGSLNVGPRLMVSREGLDRAQLIRAGSRAAQRYLFLLPKEGLEIAEARQILEGGFRGDRIADFREVHPTIRRGLERSTNFLSLVSLIAIIVGSLGVAMAMHSHLQQRLDSIAIMKCLGARSSQITRIYLLQTLGLGLIGSALGIAVGYGVQLLFPVFVANMFPQAPEMVWQPSIAGMALAIGILTTLLFTLPPLLSIRRVKPAVIFRRDAEAGTRSFWSRLKAGGPALVTGGVIVLGLAAIAGWLGDSAILAVWFAGGLVVSVIALSISAWVLVRVLKRVPRIVPFRLPTAVRHGIANLQRPGLHAEVLLVSLGIGVMFTLCIYLIQTTLLSQIVRSAPPEMPNIFYTGVTEAESEELLSLIRPYSLEGEPDLTASVPARLRSVDGTPLEQLNLEGPGRRLRATQTCTWMDEQPDYLDVLRGAWWPEDELQGVGGYVSVRENTADILKIDIGSRLEWNLGARNVVAEVAAIHRVEGFRPAAGIPFIFTKAALQGAPRTYYGGVRVAEDKAIEVQKVVYDRFPSVTIFNAGDVLNIVQDVVDQIGVVIRFVSTFAILAGVVILISSVMATRFRRIREVAILKTLGATRKKVARVFSVEFLVLGGTAGLIGAGLASIFSGLLSTRALDLDFEFQPLPNLAAVVLSAAVANIAGTLASFPILGKKPMEVLRDE